MLLIYSWSYFLLTFDLSPMYTPFGLFLWPSVNIFITISQTITFHCLCDLCLISSVLSTGLCVCLIFVCLGLPQLYECKPDRLRSLLNTESHLNSGKPSILVSGELGWRATSPHPSWPTLWVAFTCVEHPAWPTCQEEIIWCRDTVFHCLNRKTLIFIITSKQDPQCGNRHQQVKMLARQIWLLYESWFSVSWTIQKNIQSTILILHPRCSLLQLAILASEDDLESYLWLFLLNFPFPHSVNHPVLSVVSRWCLWTVWCCCHFSSLSLLHTSSPCFTVLPTLPCICMSNSL